MSNDDKRKYFYVYYSYEPWGRGYIGKRECKCLPEEDLKYFGSYRDKTFKPTEKIVLEIFNTRKEVYKAEKQLHDFYQVDKNPHFANKSKITDDKFYYVASGKDHHGYGKRPADSTIEGARRRMLSDDNPAKSEEFRKRHSELMKKEGTFSTNKNPSKNLERQKKLSENMTNFLLSLSEEKYRQTYSDRIEKTKILFKGEGNPFYNKTHTQEVKDFLGDLSRGTKWWNNGKENRHCIECPGEGWVAGMYYEINPLKGKKRDKEIVDKVRESNCKYIYTFISPEGQIIESSYVNEVCQKYDLNYSGVVRVSRGERSHYKGWKILRRPRNKEDK
jgi:hypothetical protein